MSIAATLPKIRHVAVFSRELRPAALVILAVLVVVGCFAFLLRQPADDSPATAPEVVASDQMSEPVAPAGDPAVWNLAQAQPQVANVVPPAEIHYASFEVDSALLPGNLLPTSSQCGITHRSAEQANRLVKDCYSRSVPGYSLVNFVSDASNGGILSTTFYVRKLLVRDLINQWGSPLGYRTNNASSVIYWAGKRAYLTSARLRGIDKIDFITFDDTEQQYQPWAALAD